MGRAAGKRQPETAEAQKRVAQVVKAIPPGQVSSYAQVAQQARLPAGPRGVARVLGQEKGLPWWRVIRSDGTLAPEVATEQARRLRREGVHVEGRRVAGAPPLTAKPNNATAGLRRARAPAISAKPHKGKPHKGP